MKERSVLQNPKFSIIISAYNVEQFISRAMSSVLKQTYSNFEVIVVNDGSTDGTLTILETFRADTRVKIITKENGGLSSTRNSGLAASKGEIIFFMDGDDYVSPNLLSVCAQKFIIHDVDAVFWGYDSVRESGSVINNGIKKTYLSGIVSGNNVLEKLAKNELNNYSWSFMTRKRCFDKIKKPVFPEGLAFEDVGSTYKIVLQMKNAYFVDLVLYHYLQRSGSITKTPSHKQFADLGVIRDDISRNVRGKLRSELLTEWNLFIDIARYQIASYDARRNRKTLSKLRSKILNEIMNTNYDKATRIKLLLIRIGVYKTIYPIFARVRWL